MKISSQIRIRAVLLLLLVSAVRGADVAILNGNVDLVISTATAGLEPDSDSDQTTQLQWSNWPITAAVKKITVQTNLASPAFTLKVQAINITSGDGTSAEVILIA